MNRVMLSAQGISKSYLQGQNELPILRDLAMTVHEGEMVAIVGKSGSGKSTLLNLLAGLDHPDSGEVTLADCCWQKTGERERDRVRNHSLGFVYQFHHLLPEFSALENVAMPLRIAGMSSAKARVVALDLLAKVGLSDRAKHRPNQLSGGERQRVAIARGLANSPAVVLMDEPTGNLDVETASEVRDLIKTLSRSASTAFVIVTHDPSFAEYADRVLTLTNGKLEDH
ncbi:ABC transporter ATP-binding protein [Umboniibacter marinipuniceus]|uniref:Lipoprotein-releasing system ATP-binding protein n=1 Tax=Umboniibacter marinipuniceus TaxID=569599 RepID=A0A3M0AFB8_9GAMM|nr:ABC transporter ATP-binding protein [Umboniibacter marinipuniceus]RMA81165.1 lipoprotein-releasing system ATP-binding protein [Umboniibacter marinipuniceus]